MRVACCLASLLFFNSAYSAIPLEGWYAGLMLGPTQSFDFSFNLINPLKGTPAAGQLSYNRSLNEAVQIGYRYDKFRSEAQLVFNQSKFNQVQIDNLLINSQDNFHGLSLSGNTHYFAAMFNTFYEFYQEDVEVRFVPYVGLGIGYASIKNTLSLRYNQRQIFGRNDSASAPMGQAIAGINYFFTDTYSLGLDYRYMSTPNHKTLNTSVSVEAINAVFNVSFD